MLRQFKLIFFILYLFLVACGGGGDGASDKKPAQITLSQPEVALTLAKGTSLSLDIDVDFHGDGVVAGTPVNSTGLPYWLSVESTSGNNSSATFRLNFNAPDFEGDYQTTLRFVTGYNDSEDFSYVDLDIKITVISPLKLAFTSDYKEDSLPDVQLLSSQSAGLASSIQPKIEYLIQSGRANWLAIEEIDTGYVFSVTTTELEPNTYLALATFESEQHDLQYVEVSYTVNEPKVSFSQAPNLSVNHHTNPETLSFSLEAIDPTNSFEWSISGTSRLINASKSQQGNKILANVLYEDLTDFTNGTYPQWIDIEYRLKTESAINRTRIPFDLTIDFTDELAILVPQISRFNIDNSTTEQDLSRNIIFSSGGFYTSWEVIETSELVKVQKSNNPEGFLISIDKEKLSQYNNGIFDQWIDLNYSINFSSELKTIRLEFILEKKISNITSITPRVAYLGTESTLRIWGESLDQIRDEDFLAEHQEFDSVSRVSDSEVEVTLKSEVTTGVYKIKIENELELESSTAELLIKPSPVFPISDLTLPGRASSVVYDAERERFYYTLDGTGNSVYKLYHDDIRWYWDSYPVSKANGIALSVDGNNLLVGSSDCSVSQIGLILDLTSGPDKKENCFYGYFGFIGEFYTGLTIVADTNQWPSIYRYPGWGTIPFSLPRVHTPIAMMSSYNTHMIWAGSPTTSGSRTAYIYDARTNNTSIWGTNAGDYYLERLFSISAKGERMSHYNDIYNEQLSLIGSLGDEKNGVNRVGISPDGTRAALYVHDTQMIQLYDISSDYGPINKIDMEYSIAASDQMVDRIVFSEDNNVLFVFTYNLETKVSKMRVLDLSNTSVE